MAKNKPLVEIDLSAALIEEVFQDWEREHPGHDAMEMGPEECSKRVVAKMIERASILEQQ